MIVLFTVMVIGFCAVSLSCVWIHLSGHCLGCNRQCLELRSEGGARSLWHECFQCSAFHCSVPWLQLIDRSLWCRSVQVFSRPCLGCCSVDPFCCISSFLFSFSFDIALSSSDFAPLDHPHTSLVFGWAGLTALLTTRPFILSLFSIANH